MSKSEKQRLKRKQKQQNALLAIKTIPTADIRPAVDPAERTEGTQWSLASPRLGGNLDVPTPEISAPTKDEALEQAFAFVRAEGWEPRVESDLEIEGTPGDDDDPAFELVTIAFDCPHGSYRQTMDIIKYGNSDRWVADGGEDGEGVETWGCNCWPDKLDMVCARCGNPLAFHEDLCA